MVPWRSRDQFQGLRQVLQSACDLDRRAWVQISVAQGQSTRRVRALLSFCFQKPFLTTPGLVRPWNTESWNKSSPWLSCNTGWTPSYLGFYATGKWLKLAPWVAEHWTLETGMRVSVMSQKWGSVTWVPQILSLHGLSVPVWTSWTGLQETIWHGRGGE